MKLVTMTGQCRLHSSTSLIGAIIFVLLLLGTPPSFLASSGEGYQSTALEISDGGGGNEDYAAAVDVLDAQRRRKIKKWQAWQRSRLSIQPSPHGRKHQRRLQWHDMGRKGRRRGKIIPHRQLVEWEEGDSHKIVGGNCTKGLHLN